MKMKKYTALGLGAIMAIGITVSSFSVISADNGLGHRSAVVKTVSYYDDYEGVTTASVNLRRSATSSSTKIMTIKKGTVVEVEEKASNGWYRVEYRDREGYVSPKYLNVYDSEYQKIDKKGTTTQKITLRAGATTLSSKRTVLAKGTKVEVEAKTSNGWYKVEYRGMEGYIQAKYIKFTTTTTTGYTYTELDDYDGITKVSTTMKSKASTTSTNLGTLPKGARVEVEGKTSNGWYKVEYRDRDVYVQAKDIKLVPDYD
ncbi:SH3 domain-containing protein [Intestinibacter sp.]